MIKNYDKNTLRKISLAIIILLLMIFFIVIYAIKAVEYLDYFGYTMLFIWFLTIMISVFVGPIKGIVFSMLNIFLYGTLILYQIIVLNNLTIRLDYIFILSYLAVVIISSYLGSLLKGLEKDYEYYNENCTKFVSRDVITGFGTINEFHKELNKEIDRVLRHKYSLSIAIIEIQYFDELINFHQNNIDEIYKMLSKTIDKSLRNEDRKYRISSKTFSLILPHTDIVGAKIVKDRIKENLNNIYIHTDEIVDNYNFELKIGVKELDGSIKNSIEFKKSAEKEIEFDVD